MENRSLDYSSNPEAQPTRFTCEVPLIGLHTEGFKYQPTKKDVLVHRRGRPKLDMISDLALGFGVPGFLIM